MKEYICPVCKEEMTKADTTGYTYLDDTEIYECKHCGTFEMGDKNV